MNLTTEALLLVIHHHTRTSCTEMRIVVRAVEQIVHTALRADGSKESSHTLLNKIVEERCDAFECRLALSLYLNLEIYFCLADATQVLNVMQLGNQPYL